MLSQRPGERAAIDWSDWGQISWASQIMEASAPPHWPRAIKTEPMLPLASKA